MNKNELVSHVAAETSATRATAERMVRAVFSAIGDALRGTSPLPSPDSGRSSFAAAPRAGVAIRKPGSPSPSRPRRCRRSRRRRPFETRSTDSVAGQAARCRPFVPATPPRQVHAFSMPTRRSARPGSRELPLRLRQADRRARASRIAWAPDAFHAEGDRTGVGANSPGRGTFVAGTITPPSRTQPSVAFTPYFRCGNNQVDSRIQNFLHSSRKMNGYRLAINQLKNAKPRGIFWTYLTAIRPQH